jgi:hypothetical protein
MMEAMSDVCLLAVEIGGFECGCGGVCFADAGNVNEEMMLYELSSQGTVVSTIYMLFRPSQASGSICFVATRPSPPTGQS